MPTPPNPLKRMLTLSTAKWKSLFRRVMLCFAGALVVAGSMGASCSPRAGMPFGLSGPVAPAVLGPTATVDQIVAAVNQNTARVQTYQATRATFSMPGLPGLPLLSGSIAAEKPDRFRLRAETRLTGPEVDLGNNAERFWFWARRNEPAGVYTARHTEFANSPARGQLPIDPAWLVEALGMTTLNPSATYQGPFPRTNGTLELRAQVTTPTGTGTRVYIIDASNAWVREQHLYDTAGSLVASVEADRFRFDPVSQASLPERASVRVPAAQLSLVIHTGPILVNAPIADGGQLWQLPQLSGYPVVDLARPQAGVAAGGAQVWDLAGAASSSPWQNTPPVHANFSNTATAPLGRLPANGVTLTGGR